MKYMKENGVTTAKAVPDGQGAIPNYVGVDDKLVAVLFAMDSPRDNVRRAVNALRYDGVGDIEMLTGDMEPQARAVAEQVGADGFGRSSCRSRRPKRCFACRRRATAW